MPRQSVPSYRLHKLSGQGRTIINGRHIYLGKIQLALLPSDPRRLSHSQWCNSMGGGQSIEALNSFVRILLRVTGSATKVSV